MKINKRFIVVISVLAIIITSIIFYKNRYIKNKYIDIDNLVYEVYTSKNGYDSNMEKHIDIKVFNSLNICNIYRKVYGKAPEIINFKLTEINQHKINNKIFVYMKYDFRFINPISKKESGTSGDSIVFQVIEKDGEPYIEKKKLYQADCDVPKAYR